MRGTLREAVDRGFDYVVFDTAGRLHIDDAMMGEIRGIRSALKPHQVLLVVDGMTGQDAVRVGEAFHREVGVMFWDRDRVSFRGGSGASGDETTGLHDAIECAAIDDQIAQQRKRLGPKRLDHNGFAIAE